LQCYGVWEKIPGKPKTCKKKRKVKSVYTVKSASEKLENQKGDLE
jgi:hypothetical protein